MVDLLNGDTTAYMAHASHEDDVTLLTPWGEVLTGWADVGKRYRFAASQMVPGSGATAVFDYIAVNVDGDLAYIVVVERSMTMFTGDSALRPGRTRVTEAFRRENGQWKMMHRHMDHLAEGQRQ